MSEQAQLETFGRLVDVLRAAELHVALVEAELPSDESWEALRESVRRWQSEARSANHVGAIDQGR